MMRNPEARICLAPPSNFLINPRSPSGGGRNYNLPYWDSRLPFLA
jgi:hypothetical protein